MHSQLLSAMLQPMPELPEVEIVCRGLALALEGRRLTGVTVRRGDLRRPIPAGFARQLTGRQVTRVSRRAKYLMLWLDNGQVVLGHLGMSGRMLVSKADGRPPGKHDHVIFMTDDGAQVTYCDPRRFGLLDLLSREALQDDPRLCGLGPEPLEEIFTWKLLEKALAGRSSAIKITLLDQTVVAGIGNIYASEALFRAGIRPSRAAGSVKATEGRRLVKAIKAVLQDAIAAGGSSLRDHRRTDGELGYFQHSFAVYDREGQPCPNCDCAEGIQRIVQGGRSTFYCAKRQG